MVFNYFKKLNKAINEEWESMKPERLHKEAFAFLQKEFGAFQYLNLNSGPIKEKEIIAMEICKKGGNIYDICWNYYFRREIFFSAFGSEEIDAQKMLIYKSCCYYYEDRKFSLRETYYEFERNVEEFQKKIPPEFPFTRLEFTDPSHGKGTYTYPSGAKYVGEFNDNDEPDGQGTLTFPSGEKYVGEFKNHQPHGKGTYTYPSGEKYVGEFKNHQPHGKGKMISKDGFVQEGEWIKGIFHKINSTISKNDQLLLCPIDELKLIQRTILCLKAEGIFLIGDLIKKSESDLIKLPNLGRKAINEINAILASKNLTLDLKKIISTDNTDFGTFEQLEKNQQGKIIRKNIQKRTYADGSIYEGEFDHNDEPDGQGTLTYADGSIYEGEFKNNKPNGKGTYSDAEGNILNGQFKNGDFVS